MSAVRTRRRGSGRPTRVARRDADRDIDAVALLEEPTRRALYDWVAAQQAAVGRDAAAAATGVSRALAAFHLDRLADAGLLETEFRRPDGRSGPGAGRPAKLYRRASRDVAVSLPPRHYDVAADVFATALERSADRSALTDAARVAGAELARTAPDGRPVQRTLTVLQTAGYEPVVDEAGIVRLRNCPFHALAERHRDVTCGMNLAFAEGLARSLGDGALQPTLNPEPGWCCVQFRPTDS